MSSKMEVANVGTDEQQQQEEDTMATAATVVADEQVPAVGAAPKMHSFDVLALMIQAKLEEEQACECAPKDDGPKAILEHDGSDVEEFCKAHIMFYAATSATSPPVDDAGAARTASSLSKLLFKDLEDMTPAEEFRVKVELLQ
jgi:hypothetical protein